MAAGVDPAALGAFGRHGVPACFFFHRGKRLGRATGWHGLAQFQAAVAAGAPATGGTHPAPSGD